MASTGVYKRGDIWWYRVGRRIRRSSRSTDINEAIAQRAQALVAYQIRFIETEWRAFVSEQRHDCNSWVRRTYSHMRRKTRIRGWEACMTIEEFTRLVLLSNGRCALTGLSFDREPATGRAPLSISVDRIDSAQGYCTGNVRMVLLAVNLAMSHWGETALRQIARALVGRELLDPLHTPLHTDFQGEETPDGGNA